MLQPDQEVTNDLIRMFIFGAVNGAIGSAEETIKDSLCNTCHHTFARHNNACDCGACEIFAANSGK